MIEIRWSFEARGRHTSGEINSFIIEVPAEKIHVDEATTLGVVYFGVDANMSKSDYVKGEVEEAVDDVNFLETGGYVAKETIEDVATGDILAYDKSTLSAQR